MPDALKDRTYTMPEVKEILSAYGEMRAGVNPIKIDEAESTLAKMERYPEFFEPYIERFRTEIASTKNRLAYFREKNIYPDGIF